MADAAPSGRPVQDSGHQGNNVMDSCTSAENSTTEPNSDSDWFGVAGGPAGVCVTGGLRLGVRTRSCEAVSDGSSSGSGSSGTGWLVPSDGSGGVAMYAHVALMTHGPLQFGHSCIRAEPPGYTAGGGV